jgi:hypothetical protein
MVILGVEFVWWHFRTPTKDGLSPKEPTGYESPVMWLWFRSTPSSRPQPRQRDIILVCADLALTAHRRVGCRLRWVWPRRGINSFVQSLTLNRLIGPNLATDSVPRSWSSVLSMDAAAVAGVDKVGAAQHRSAPRAFVGGGE